jgi:hypothetical protein
VLATEWPTRHSGIVADDGKPQRLAMPRVDILRWWSTWDTMTIRGAAIATIALTILLSTVIALAAMFAGDVNERSIDIVKTVLLSFGGLLTGLLIFLRLETLSGKADSAASHAAAAAQKAAVVETKVDTVVHDIRNDVLRRKVFDAIKEAEHDPEIQRIRVQNIATGVQQDRHDKAQRDTISQNQERYDDMKSRRGAEGD